MTIGTNAKKRGTASRKLQRQQTALAQFGSYAFREPELRSVLTEAARLTAEGTDVPFSNVLKYRARENDLIVEAGVGWQKNVIGRSIAKADESSPGGRAFATGKPVITTDLRRKTDFVLPPIYGDHGIVSTANVLVQGSGERPYGVLEIGSPKLRRFDQHDIDFIQGFANVLAEAVASAERTTLLRSTVRQKDALARELQNRVRNNLQIVYRMLEKEARKTVDQVAKRGILGVARRVIVLGQVYEHLLGLGLSQTIDFGEYLKSLCVALAEFFEAQRPDIKIIVQTDSLVVDVEDATALGVIVNELVTNSYEHAFDDDGKGTINVVLQHRDDAKAMLIVSDSGPGFMPQNESKRNGLSLVLGLVKQVRGTVDLRTDSGTVWTIALPVRAPAAA